MVMTLFESSTDWESFKHGPSGGLVSGCGASGWLSSILMDAGVVDVNHLLDLLMVGPVVS